MGVDITTWRARLGRWSGSGPKIRDPSTASRSASATCRATSGHVEDLEVLDSMETGSQDPPMMIKLFIKSVQILFCKFETVHVVCMACHRLPP